MMQLPRSNRKIILGLSALLGLALMGQAQAQTAPANTPVAQATGTGAALPLPTGVNRVISIDAFDTLLVQLAGDNGPSYNLLAIQHVYSGGIARLFGGTSIPTAQFVSPGGAAGNAGAGTGGTPFGVTSIFGNGGGAPSTGTQANTTNGTAAIGVLGLGLVTPKPAS